MLVGLIVGALVGIGVREGNMGGVGVGVEVGIVGISISVTFSTSSPATSPADCWICGVSTLDCGIVVRSVGVVGVGKIEVEIKAKNHNAVIPPILFFSLHLDLAIK